VIEALKAGNHESQPLPAITVDEIQCMFFSSELKSFLLDFSSSLPLAVTLKVSKHIRLLDRGGEPVYYGKLHKFQITYGEKCNQEPSAHVFFSLTCKSNMFFYCHAQIQQNLGNENFDILSHDQYAAGSSSLYPLWEDQVQNYAD